MDVVFRKFLSSLEYKIIYLVIIVILLFALVLVRTIEQRHSEFNNYHHQVAEISTLKISHKVNDIMIKKHRLVTSFYEDNIKLLESIIHNPQNIYNYEKLNNKLGRYFNDYFTTNIIDENTQLIVDKFEENIGVICLDDVKTYIQHNEQSIRIHPNHSVYHYDILVNIKIKGKKYIFFVSFNTDEISSLLQVSQHQFHDLIIVNTTEKNLIAITAEGSRENLIKRTDIYLSTDEESHILSSQNIQGTQWKILDIYHKNLFTTFKKALYKEEFIIFIIFLTITIVMGLIIISALRIKESLANTLLEKNNTIVALNEKLQDLAVRDGLTGLFNRRYYDETSLLKYRAAKRLDIVYNVAILDIDFFKPFNDNYGHVKGDECLCRVAACIASSFKRSNEFSARYGGEEFVIVSIGEEKEVFNSRIKALLVFLTDEAIKHEFSDTSPYLTLSAGSSSSKDSKLNSVKEHLEEADDRLYKAKEGGRNRLVC